MIAVGVQITGIAGLAEAVARGRAAAMRAQAEWVAETCRANIAAQRDPWGRSWRPKSRNSDGGRGPALEGYGARIQPVWTDTSWDVRVDDEHASSHQFGRAKVTRGASALRGTARRATAAARTAERVARSEARAGRADDGGFLAARASASRAEAATARSRLGSHSGEPPRAILPLRVRRGQEPLVDFPPEWTVALDAIMEREVQREIDALRAPLR